MPRNEQAVKVKAMEIQLAVRLFSFCSPFQCTTGLVVYSGTLLPLGVESGALVSRWSSSACWGWEAGSTASWSWASPADLGWGHGASLARPPVPPRGLSLLLPHPQAFPGSTWWRPVGKSLQEHVTSIAVLNVHATPYLTLKNVLTF